jgi:hypothetical protein
LGCLYPVRCATTIPSGARRYMCRFALSFNQRSSRLTVSPADAFNEYTCRSDVHMIALLWTTVAGVLAVADTAYTNTATRAVASPARAAQVRRLAIWYDLL